MRTFLLLQLLFLSWPALADPAPRVRFVENKNQWPSPYKFGADIPLGQIRFATDHILFSFWEDKKSITEKGEQNKSPHAEYLTEAGTVFYERNAHNYEVRFLNANAMAVISGEEETPTRFNYYLGRDRAKWVSNAGSYLTLNYQNVYCGIDMRYYTEKGRMKYEWIVSPQVDPSQIQIHYNGVNSIYIDNNNLHIETTVNEIWEMEPFAYQIVNGERVKVPCRYELKNNTVSYSFPDGYDECIPLVIDPILIFSAYSGSTLDNWGNTATYDARGNVYSGGIVTNNGFQSGYPLTPGAFQLQYGGGQWDVGILKYDSAGSKLLYCTYIGGSGTETPQSLVTTATGELLILGATSSSDFPVTNGSQFKGGDTIDPLWGVPYNNGTDLFVVKLSANGDQLLGSTYLGGTENDGVNFISGFMNSTTNKTESPLARNYGDQLRGDIITDENDFVYIASSTLSSDFPAINTYGGGSHDAVVVKLQPDLSSIVWGRFIGGSGTDAAYSIKLDKTQNIFVAGGTTSGTIAGMNGFKTVNSGNIDGWILSLTNDGEPVDGTFLGTAQYDQAYFVDLNDVDEVFVFGQTLGTYVSGSTGRQFVHKLSHDLKTSHWARVVGPGTISPTAFLVSDCGYIYLSGWGGNTNATTLDLGSGNILTRNYIGGSTVGLPVTEGAYQSSTSGNDFYFLVLSDDGTQNLYATFLGGNSSATHVDGGTSRFDKKGIVYHAVCAGCGGLSDFPAVNVPLQHQRNRSSNCNNAVFKFDLSLLKARLQTNSILLDRPGLNNVCLTDPIVFQNKSNGGETFEWDLGDGTKITKHDTVRFSHVYKNTGRYKVWLKAIDKGTCQVKDSVSTFVDVTIANGVIQDDDTICEGEAYQLKASGADQYHWRSEDNSFTSNEASPNVKPQVTTKYYIRIIEGAGCEHIDSVTINVIPNIIPEFEYEKSTDCSSIPSIKVKNLTEGVQIPDAMYFDFGDGNTSDASEAVYQYTKGGDYTIRLVGVRESCVNEKVVPMHFQPLLIPNIFTPGQPDGKNDVFSIQVGDDPLKTPLYYDLRTELSVYDRWGRPVFEDDNYQHNWNAADVSGGVYYYQVTVQEYPTCKGWVHIVK